MEKNKNMLIPAAILGAGALIAVSIFATGGLNIPTDQGRDAQLGGEQGKAISISPELYRELARQLKADVNQFNDCVEERTYSEKVESDFQEGIRLGVTGTPGSFVNGRAVRGALPYAQLKSIIDSELAEPTLLPEDFQVREGDYIRGNPNAPITLVEFSDLECPFCKRFHPTVQQALEEYGDQLRWVYKHYPIDQIHPQARPAAEAAECVGEQKGNEGFWQFIDAIFALQT